MYLGMKHDALIKIGMQLQSVPITKSIQYNTRKENTDTEKKNQFVVFVTCNIHACRRTFVNEAIRTSSELDPRVFLYIDRNTIFNESNQIRSLNNQLLRI